MHTSIDPQLLSRIVDDLAEQGWTRQEGFLPAELTAALCAECRQLAIGGELKLAEIGRGSSQAVRPDVRGDHIGWLYGGESASVDRYLAQMDELRTTMNRELQAGLEDFESHFAQYPAGAFYRRHTDRFRDDDRRTISAIVYLNQQWKPGDGGQLRMVLRDGSEQDIEPLGGSLVLFRSDEFPHEVLPATRVRQSLTGWFRRRDSNPF